MTIVTTKPPPTRARIMSLDRLLWSAAFGCLALVGVLSLAAIPPGAGAFENADKIYHACLYAGTSFLFLLAAVWRPGRGDGRYPWAARWLVLAACVAGFAIEGLQGLIGRQRSLLDGLADVTGVLLALRVWLALRRKGIEAERT